ncbi:SMI1/KNR4 family protein [Streptomyces sp. NPDC032940]|uniref:SMI1/KNR4 family protein n=1 Tax=Streptomyces sp. NPDC032940 TaxID=3155366 RepID=UPI0033E94C3E
MWALIGELMRARTREYLAASPLYPEGMPRLRPPASPAQIESLQSFAGQPLNPEYRKFLSLTDGFDGFQYAMPLLGCRDWENPQQSGIAAMFRDIVLETGSLEEVGLQEETCVFPIFVNSEGSAGIMMLHTGDTAAEQFWWTGAGDDMFFRTFRDLLTYVTDPLSYSPRQLFD